MEWIKRFAEWLQLKEKTHESEHSPFFNEGEVWWCKVGENIGTEINGKSSLFTRPVLIFKKLDSKSFVGIALSTVSVASVWYAPITFKGKSVTVVISQVRTMSVKRLCAKMGELTEDSLETVAIAFHKLYFQSNQIFFPPSFVTKAGLWDNPINAPEEALVV